MSAADVLDALVAFVAAAVGPTVRVDDGPPITDLEAPDAVGIGISIQDAPPGTAQLGFDLASQQAELDVVCVAQSWDGSTDLATRRRRAFELLDTITAALNTRPDLGMTGVWQTRVVAWSYQPIRDDKGVMALVEFTVRINLYR